MDYYLENSKSWDHESKNSGPWSRPVTKEQIELARNGKWSIVLTPVKAVPRNWFPTDMRKSRILLVAGGGGQQAPIISATGAETYLIDASIEQLKKDEQVAKENNLSIKTIQGNMTDLSQFKDEEFDLIINPCSNCFISDVRDLWKECYRVLKIGGKLMSGSLNPIWFASNRDKQEKGIFEIVNKIPTQYKCSESGHWEFGHSLEDLIAGQLDCGFKMCDFYEDGWGHQNLDKFLNQYIATLSEK